MARQRRRNGFSLVELAVVLMIVGLLLAGVMKGTEMVENAKINEFVTDVNKYEAAVSAFKNIYGELPGDMRGGATRLPDCSTAPCNADGDGDGYIALSGHGNMWFCVVFYDYTEGRRLWVHLSRAGLVPGAIMADYTGTPNLPGVDYPKVPGGTGAAFDVYYWTPPSGPFNGYRGHVLKTAQSPINTGSNYALTASMAAKIDRKMDDGRPMTGKVVAWKSLTDGCYVSAGTPVYGESDRAIRCNVAVRMSSF